MTEKLKDYQVLDVFCCGTMYKVRHKVTNNIFAWKAYNCFAFSDEKIQDVDYEVKTLSKVLSGNFLRYYDTILHRPTKTLYFVLEYNSWQSVQELISLCKAADKHFTENFIWFLLLELARICKVVENLNFVTLKKCLSAESIFVGPNGELRVNCFELSLEDSESTDLVRQIGEVLRTLCYHPGACDDKIEKFEYSDDLRDVINFLTDERTTHLRPDVVLYHPTVLANTDSLLEPKNFTDIFTSTACTILNSKSNKCDSEKAVEQCKALQNFSKSQVLIDSTIYCNVSPKWNTDLSMHEDNPPQGSLSPTIAALALELPGFVPRSRKPYSGALENCNGPQMTSERIFSQQWMSRLIALREREESLNRRERNLLAKEIMNSPSMDKVSVDEETQPTFIKSNGITLPPVLNQVDERTKNWVSRRHQRQSSSTRSRARRKSYAYEDLDSSLSADNGDSSMIITAAKMTKENMPCRNIFPETTFKKVNMASSNPFAGSDESVTLTFYELDNAESNNYRALKKKEKGFKDITKFKYLDFEKVPSEKRAAMQWTNSSPSKQAKITGKILSDITNKNLIKSSPKNVSTIKHSKLPKSNSDIQQNSDYSSTEIKNQGYNSKLAYIKTPEVIPELRKSKRKSIMSFKTPFKFKTSTKV